jgi:hypothetical protein
MVVHEPRAHGLHDHEELLHAERGHVIEPPLTGAEPGRGERLQAPGEQLRRRPGCLAAQERGARPQRLCGASEVRGHLLEEVVLRGARQAVVVLRAHPKPARRRPRRREGRRRQRRVGAVAGRDGVGERVERDAGRQGDGDVAGLQQPPPQVAALRRDDVLRTDTEPS